VIASSRSVATNRPLAQRRWMEHSRWNTAIRRRSNGLASRSEQPWHPDAHKEPAAAGRAGCRLGKLGALRRVTGKQ
jgi:hypothetical protein